MTNKFTDMYGGNSHGDIESEAAAWMAQLDGGSITEQDLATFRQWVNRSPAHAAMISKYQKHWTELNELSGLSERIWRADRMQRDLRNRDKRQSKFRKFGAVSAVMAVLIGGPLVYTNSAIYAGKTDDKIYAAANVSLPTIINTLVGEQLKHTLKDGSVVTLNTNSEISVDYRLDERRITLVKGEAFFEVEKSKDRPFTVFAGEGMVKALGTAFSVYRLNGNFELLVSEGSVQLSSIVPSKANAESNINRNVVKPIAVVMTGQKATFENGQTSIDFVDEADVAAKLSWQYGFLTFNGQPMSEIVAEFMRYNDINIEISDPALNDLKLGGGVGVTDVEAFLSIVENELNIRVDDVGEKHVRFSFAKSE